MSVLIKGMDMPKSCYSCPLYRVLTPSHSKCTITDTQFDRTDENNVAKTCPLVGVPTPHGRLIDADALRSVLWLRGKEFSNSEYGEGVKCGLADAREFIKNAPPIIPASDSS